MGILDSLKRLFMSSSQPKGIDDYLSGLDNEPKDELYLLSKRKQIIGILSGPMSYMLTCCTYLEEKKIELEEEQKFELFILFSNYALDQASKQELFSLTKSQYALWLFELNKSFLNRFNINMTEKQLLDFYNKRFIDLKRMMEVLDRDRRNSVYVTKYFYRLIFDNEGGRDYDFGTAFDTTMSEHSASDTNFKTHEDRDVAFTFSPIFFKELMECSDWVANQKLVLPK